MRRGPADAVPVLGDLPGSGWTAIDEGFASEPGEGGPGEFFDCVGPAFPEDAVLATAVSPHFVRAPRSLVHGIGLEMASPDDARVAAGIVAGSPFATCLGRSVAADLSARPVDTELLAVDVEATGAGYRVRFTGGDEHGIRPVYLDIVSLRIGPLIGLLWLGDTPEPFAPADLAHITESVERRLSS